MLNFDDSTAYEFEYARGGGGSEPAEQPDGRRGSLMAAGSADAVKQLAADESPMIMMLKSVSAVE